jgi:hypothetical protein
MLSMREFLKSSGRWFSVGWFWPLVLLALPTCALLAGVEDWKADPGPEPVTSAIMCDIPNQPDALGITCADANTDLTGLMSKSQAAVALVESNQTTSLVVDYSQEARMQCPGGFPQLIQFHGPFPDGLPFCLNCQTQLPTVYANGNEACIAKCKDLFNVEGSSVGETFCEQHAHVSTNFDPNGGCYSDVCSPGGTPHDFIDPRRQQELVIWDAPTLKKAEANGNTLTRTDPADGFYSAGGASKQRITTGDAWVEFEAGQTQMGHVLGVSFDDGSVDTDPSFADIDFGISLDFDESKVFIIENGAIVAGPFDPYEANERFRIRIQDNNDVDHTATITYFRLDCDNSGCLETQFASQIAATGPKYPLRVDASLLNEFASLANVTMVRIIEFP